MSVANFFHPIVVKIFSVQRKSQEIAKDNRIHHLGTMNIYTEFHGKLVVEFSRSKVVVETNHFLLQFKINFL